VTSQEPKTPQSADHEIPDTEVLVVSAPSPVFVDSTGRRRRHLQRLAYVFGAVCALYGGLISVSLAGGPVSATAIRSLPDLPDHEVEPGQARPSPTPEPTVTTPPKTRFISESLPRDLPVPGGRRFVVLGQADQDPGAGLDDHPAARDHALRVLVGDPVGQYLRGPAEAADHRGHPLAQQRGHRRQRRCLGAGRRAHHADPGSVVWLGRRGVRGPRARA
jgi:hypothetical protein